MISGSRRQGKSFLPPHGPTANVRPPGDPAPRRISSSSRRGLGPWPPGAILPHPARAAAESIRSLAPISHCGGTGSRTDQELEIGRGGIRTRTGVAPHRILSPVRLPFRHSAAEDWPPHTPSPERSLPPDVELVARRGRPGRRGTTAALRGSVIPCPVVRCSAAGQASEPTATSDSLRRPPLAVSFSRSWGGSGLPPLRCEAQPGLP